MGETGKSPPRGRDRRLASSTDRARTDPLHPDASELTRLDQARARITTAMIDLCFERGYARIELAELLSRAGVGEADFHRLFVDLEDCFCLVYTEIRDDFLARLERALAGQPDWRGRLRASAYVLLRFLTEDEKVTHLGTVEVQSAGERSRRLFAEATTRLYELIDEGRDERGLPDSITPATAQAIGGASSFRFTPRSTTATSTRRRSRS
jgi:AcrR family transcriptional regulator